MKEVMVLSALVYLFAGRITQNTTHPISQNSVEMWHIGREEARQDIVSEYW